MTDYNRNGTIYTSQLHIRLEPEVHAWVRERARRDGIYPSQLIRQYILSVMRGEGVDV